MNFYPHHIGDFNNATRHLTRVERSLYADCIWLYYDTEQPLQATDFEMLARKVMARSDEEKAALKVVLAEFFVLDGSVYRNVRCDAEIDSYRAKYECASKAGKASAAKRAQQKMNGGSTDVERTNAKRSTNHEPRTSNQEPKVKSSGVAHAAHRPAAKASRLPADWLLPRLWGEWAMQEQSTWTADHARKVSDSFRDYWIAKSGKDATKTDWEATWRNWVRREKPMTTGVSTNGKTSIHDQRAATIAALTGSGGVGRTFDVTPEPPRP